ncbi:hypothetical protein L1049_019316 [Liquidambar formosana]|uniref:NADP-dependent oxidoreductase domain-containing protein n=1 Tax=Liquidambar formosana TaxID=63359 RepID=A0AAP0XA21_LIQFO
MKQLPRENVQLATKFGIVKFDMSDVVVNGSPEYARACCEACLKRLGVDYIDLYYRHWIDNPIPIEETESVDKNKVFYSRIEKLAEKQGCTPAAQLALAWVLHQGNDVVPIPGG